MDNLCEDWTESAKLLQLSVVFVGVLLDHLTGSGLEGTVALQRSAETGLQYYQCTDDCPALIFHLMLGLQGQG